jgi:hypothetical protein
LESSDLSLELNLPLSSRNLSFGIRYARSGWSLRKGHAGRGFLVSASLTTDYLLRALNGGFLMEDLYSPGLGLALRGGMIVHPRPRRAILLPQPTNYGIGLVLRSVLELDNLLKPGNGLSLDTYLRGDIGGYFAVVFSRAAVLLTLRPVSASAHWEGDVTRYIPPRMGAPTGPNLIHSRR